MFHQEEHDLTASGEQGAGKEEDLSLRIILAINFYYLYKLFCIRSLFLATEFNGERVGGRQYLELHGGMEL